MNAKRLASILFAGTLTLTACATPASTQTVNYVPGTQSVAQTQVVEQQRFAIAGRSSTSLGRAAKNREPRTDQAVARLQPVIQETERPIAGEGRQPQRQTGQLHGHWIQVDAV